jgi:hypothetical protein
MVHSARLSARTPFLCRNTVTVREQFYTLSTADDGSMPDQMLTWVLLLIQDSDKSSA